MARDDIPQEAAFIYAMQAECGGPIKVGHSSDPERRAAHLSRGLPSPIRVFAQKRCHPKDRLFVERYAHAIMWPRRVRGEWFDVTQEQAALALEIAVRQTEAGKLPPGLTERAANGFGPRRVRRAGFLDVLSRNYTADEARAALAYRDLFDDAEYEARARTMCRNDIGKIDLLGEVHAAVAEAEGRAALTLLIEVIGKDCAVLDLPGSHRQAGYMKRVIKRCLPHILRLTATRATSYTNDYGAESSAQAA